MSGFGDVGKVWDAASFRAHVRTQDLSWVRGITMHHTAIPNHSQRPKGFTIQHMRNLESYYRGKLGWSAGPHLFVDDDEIFGMCPLDRRGVHAKSFNLHHIGIEVLGNYDVASPASGRGKACWGMAAQACAILLAHMGKDAKAINGHRDDPRTSKTCPGKKVDLDAFRAQVATLMAEGDFDRDDPAVNGWEPLRLAQIADAIEWQTQKLRGPAPDKTAIKEAILWQVSKL